MTTTKTTAPAVKTINLKTIEAAKENLPSTEGYVYPEAAKDFQAEVIAAQLEAKERTKADNAAAKAKAEEEAEEEAAESEKDTK